MFRIKQFLLKLTQDEYEEIKKRAGDLPMSVYIRKCCLGDSPAKGKLSRETPTLAEDDYEVVKDVWYLCY